MIHYVRATLYIVNNTQLQRKQVVSEMSELLLPRGISPRLTLTPVGICLLRERPDHPIGLPAFPGATLVFELLAAQGHTPCAEECTLEGLHDLKTGLAWVVTGAHSTQQEGAPEG